MAETVSTCSSSQVLILATSTGSYHQFFLYNPVIDVAETVSTCSTSQKLVLATPTGSCHLPSTDYGMSHKSRRKDPIAYWGTALFNSYLLNHLSSRSSLNYH